MKATLSVLLANIGFVLQVSGILVLVPIAASFILNETSATVALFITATSLLAFGFLTNSLCEKKEMTYRQSCILVVLVFVILGLIGAIPYFYINFSVGDFSQLITDSIFESVSGFTTTGFSVIPDLEVLPKSIILYRSMTQFIGGIGIVLVLLAFFYPEAKLKEFAKSMGLYKENHRIKKTFLFIISIYCAVTAIMIAVSYLAGYHELINLSSLVFAAISTGGFVPFSGAELTAVLTQPPLNIVIPLCMLFGATNFLLFAELYKRKFKSFLYSETTFFLIIISVSCVLLFSFFNISATDAGFHVLSAMSTTGFSYMPIGNIDTSLTLFLISIMFIGGASLSTAGGIKIYRFLLLIKTIGKTVTYVVSGKDNKVKLFDKLYSNAEIIQIMTLMFLMVAVIFISAMVLSLNGYDPLNSIFESTSAITTAGLSTGVVGPELSLGLKWLFIFLMILGRVEVVTFLVIFSRSKEKSIGLAVKNQTESIVVSDELSETPSEFIC